MQATYTETTFMSPYGTFSESTYVLTIIKVDIVHPEVIELTVPPGLDYSEFKYVFNDATPGVLTVTPEGTCGVPALDPNLEWELTAFTGGAALPGSTLTTSPDPPKGATPTFTFTGLPLNNSSFNVYKNLSLEYPDSGCDPEEERIWMFFPRDESNHPGAGSGTDPNWYYYWSDAGADVGTHQYNATIVYDGQYTFGDNYFEIGPSAKGTDTHPAYVEGIDNFGSTCLHEKKHMDYYFASWNPYVAADDQDNDHLKDSEESTMTGMDGNPYDPLKTDTDGDGYDDGEDWASKAEATWTVGSKDSVDWADPGHQHDF